MRNTQNNVSDGSYYIKTEPATSRSLANHATYSIAIFCYMSRFLERHYQSTWQTSNYMSDGKIGRTDVFFSLTDKDEQRMSELITLLKGYEG